MIRHIVFLKIRFNDDYFYLEDMLIEVRIQLNFLFDIIPGIGRFEIREVIPFYSTSPELVLICDFADMDSLIHFMNHPAHLAFIKWNKNNHVKMSTVDYRTSVEEFKPGQEISSSSDFLMN
ncbi:MAG: Dabb family protein [Lentimicrobium sp.]|nr:Dabb family protein [Lentimicrobium sp.]